jgi:uncharacterized protein YbaR (Trm112 family)
MKLAPELLELLVCPRCKGELALADDESRLVCPSCCLKYPVVDGIPHLLIDEAEATGDREPGTRG